MDERRIFDKINGILEDSDYPVEISDIAGIEEFLNDVDNEKYSFYGDIEGLYNKLLGYDEDEGE
ncbi:MAG: hypothetical protein N2645_14880 [Clostridia bacterium]|nr:hypothetical protein [Clostridia bacterium]